MPFGRRDGGLNPHPSDGNQFQPTNPPNANVIVNRFKTPTPPPPVTPPEPSELQAAPNSPFWLKTRPLLRSAVEDKQLDAAGAVGQALH